MKWTRKLSLRRKLTLVIMINTVVALCAAGIGFAEYGGYRFSRRKSGNRVSGRGHGRVQTALGGLFVLFRPDRRCRLHGSVCDGRPAATPDLESDPPAGLDHEDGNKYPGLFHSGGEAFGGRSRRPDRWFQRDAGADSESRCRVTPRPRRSGTARGRAHDRVGTGSGGPSTRPGSIA